MKKSISILIMAAALLCAGSAIAHDKVVVIPLNSSSSRISNNSSSCDSSTAGIIRWTGLSFEGCNGKTWTLLSPVPTVYSSGHEWMDRNLGASRVATSPTDTEAYGDLYQCGRFSDGHEKRTSSITAALSSTDTPGHGKFIITGISPYDWRSSQNDNLWKGSGINNPCPPGFRLPTYTEWEAEIASWSSNDPAGAFGSPLKLVLAGSRSYLDGTLSEVDIQGNYWAGPDGGGNARFMVFGNSFAHTSFYYRAFGFSVRCIKN